MYAANREYLAHGYIDGKGNAIPPPIVVRRNLAVFYDVKMTRATWVGELSTREIAEAWVWLEAEAEYTADLDPDGPGGGVPRERAPTPAVIDVDSDERMRRLAAALGVSEQEAD